LAWLGQTALPIKMARAIGLDVGEGQETGPGPIKKEIKGVKRKREDRSPKRLGTSSSASVRSHPPLISTASTKLSPPMPKEAHELYSSPSGQGSSAIPAHTPVITKPARGRTVPVGSPVAPYVNGQSTAGEDSRSLKRRSSKGALVLDEGSQAVAISFAPSSAQSGLGISTSMETSKQTESRPHICGVPGCGKCFGRKEHLRRHMRSIHTESKRGYGSVECFRFEIAC
jgi:Zinc finger, C2H2 type